MSSSPSKQYMIHFADGGDIGPLDEAAIRSLAQSGRLRPNDLVAKQGSAKWTAAGDIRGLFPTDARRAAAMPPAGKSIPPVVVTSSAHVDASTRPTSVGHARPLTGYQVCGILLLGLIPIIIFQGPKIWNSSQKKPSNMAVIVERGCMSLDALKFSVTLEEAKTLQSLLDKHMQNGSDTRALVETLWNNLDPMPGFSPKASPFSESNAQDFIAGVTAARKRRYGS